MNSEKEDFGDMSESMGSSMTGGPFAGRRIVKEKQVVGHKRRCELSEWARNIAAKIEQEVKVHERGIFFAMLENLLSGEVR